MANTGTSDGTSGFDPDHGQHLSAADLGLPGDRLQEIQVSDTPTVCWEPSYVAWSTAVRGETI